MSTPEDVLAQASPTMPGDVYYDVVCEEKRLGMKFNGIEVTTIFEDSWAARSGIQLDDEIHLVNGKRFYAMNRDEKLAALQGPRPLIIKLKRPEIKDAYYTLTLEELKLGMGFKGARVINVTPGGWAERSGVLINDEIAEVGGTGFSNLNDDQKIELFKKPRPFDIKFKRPARLRKQQVAKGGVAHLAVPGVPFGMPVGNEIGNADNRPTPIQPEPRREPSFFECLCCRPAAETNNDIEVTRPRRSIY
ncbi:unnamed protein product [Amoebophrya sp. A120]|nr:unnamed protein product [Amoebophrya sp. A120]|eukprot:GSA120T00015251001.1